VTAVKISAKEEYGLRCMLQLASRASEQDTVTVKEIADHEGLSTAYVGKLLWTLSRAGLTVSVRGVEGGYRLARDPSTISLGDVLRALGGLPSSAGSGFCGQFPGATVCCVHMPNCTLHSVWSGIMTQVQSVLDQTPLSALISRTRSAKEPASVA